MECARVISPIREQDERFMRIQELIETKKNILNNKRQKLRSILKQNEFLEVVKNDYENYYNYIAQQKRDQIRALQALDEYIKDLTHSGKLTKHNMEDAKEEQFKILNEMKSIKDNLDSIISNTKDIQNTLDKKNRINYN